MIVGEANESWLDDVVVANKALTSARSHLLCVELIYTQYADMDSPDLDDVVADQLDEAGVKIRIDTLKAHLTFLAELLHTARQQANGVEWLQKRIEAAFQLIRQVSTQTADIVDRFTSPERRGGPGRELIED